ncbi:MAG: CoA-binding protein [Ilumatobacter fluminis]|jgi:hypothetical protein|uniref:CoA-binding protein n=1 Tax=Ilumatobacter fluminis TaxID=467091 RepID=UPI0032EDD033
MPLIDDNDGLRALLRRTQSVAVVGVSDNPRRPSHTVTRYLIDHTDWTLWFVNPTVDELFGRPVYPSLDALPDVPDMVDVFRRTEHLAGVVDESIAIGATSVWFQLGLVDDVAATRAVHAGLDVVQDRCLEIEFARLIRR